MRERPDYSHAPEVAKILNEDPIFEKENSTEEEVRENEGFWKEFRESPVVKFLAQAEKIADMVNELELKENDRPYRDEDKKLWQAVPRVIGPDGRPMPRKAIKTGGSRMTSSGILQGSSFLDFGGSASGPTRPAGLLTLLRLSGISGSKSSIKISSEIMKWIFEPVIMRNGGFYSEDRLGRTRAPLELITLKTAWGAGIIDKDTFIWGEDMDEWAPIHMVYGLEPAIATWEVRLAAGATALIHKLQKGIPPWVPLKGHEKKTYKQLQEEAVESKRRDLAVLEANDGVWPPTPSHALFLWASGSELTTILEEDHMPNKYIPKALRDVQALPLNRCGFFRVQRLYNIFTKLSTRVYQKLELTIPGFDKIMENVHADATARDARRKARREAEMKAEQEKALGIQSDP
ncbi:hypothetical protein PS2_032741 [Malus domestica]